MPSADEIVEMFRERKKRQEPRFAVMREIDAAYAGELDVPLPELNRSEKVMVANLVQQGIDQTSTRVASTLPEPDFPPTRAGYGVHEDRARTKHDVVLSWWAMNNLGLELKKRARWLVSYAIAPVAVLHEPGTPYPVWKSLDPFSTFLPPPSPTREFTPLDAIYTYTQPLRWLERLYPGHMRELHKGRDPSPDMLFTCCQYLGYDEIVLVVLGEYRSDDVYAATGPGKPFVELDRAPNQAGICPVVAPVRISLNHNKPMGQFDGLVPMYWNQSLLMSLGAIAAKRDIFRDLWTVARPNETVEIVTEADGLRGIIGEIAGGDIKTVAETPGAMTMPMIDRLERAIRLTGGIPAEFGGESVSNIRTGRRGQQVLSAAIDFNIQEAQQILEVSLREENVRAIAVDKAYFGPQSRSVYFDWKGRQGGATYTPDDLWDSDRHSVRYSYPGADQNELVISGGQLLGMGTLSKERFMELIPYIEDPELEHGRILAESLEQAGLQGLQNALVSGQMPPDDWAFIAEQVVEKRVPLYKAVQAAQKRAQERQASSGEPGTPTGPVEPGAPEAQPGLAPPGAGAEQPAAIPEGPPSMQNLSAMLRNLRTAGRGAA